MKINFIIEVIKGLPKSIYFNIKYFGLKKGLKMPILLSSKVKFLSLNGKVELNEMNKFGIVRIGFPSCGIFDYTYSRSIWQLNGTIKFQGGARLGQGTKISIGKNGYLEFGKSFTVTGETQFICHKRIIFGDNCLVSWENLFLDTDFHKIIKNGNIMNEDRDILIKNNVWIGSRCTILKGTEISSNTVVASCSLVRGKYKDGNIIIGGNPGEKRKENIFWKI